MHIPRRRCFSGMIGLLVQSGRGVSLPVLTWVALCIASPQWCAAGGTLKATMANDPKYVDPFWATAYVTRNHGYMIYDTLFALDANLQPQPQMVETWQVSPDGMTYTFTLRSGLHLNLLSLLILTPATSRNIL